MKYLMLVVWSILVLSFIECGINFRNFFNYKMTEVPYWRNVARIMVDNTDVR